MKIKKLVALLLACALILSFGAIGSVSAAEAGSSDTLTWVLIGDITGLDPTQSYDDITNMVTNQLYQGILTYDTSVDSNLTPDIAESWEIVDELTYVYNIKPDLLFSDGAPITMEDILWNLDRQMDPANASLVGWMFDCVESIEQTGDWQFTVKLSYPDATFQYVLGTSAGYIMEKAPWEADGTVIASGPYAMESRVTGSNIILTKNENYFNADSVYFDRIVFNVIGEDTTRVEALSTGQADFSTNPPFDMLEQLKADPNVAVTMFDTFGVDFVAMNTQRAPFDDVNVRRAVASAIDVNTIYDALLVDICGPSSGLPFNASLYASIGDPAEWTAYAEAYKEYVYDVEQAKAYLAESAYPDGFTCSLVVPESSVLNSEALFIQATLAEIGINVEINKIPQNDVYAIQMGTTWDAENDCRDFDMGFFTWYADFPDAAGTLVPNYLSSNAAPGGCNVSGYSNERVDELLMEQTTKTTAADRMPLCMEALDIIAEEVPVVIIDYPRQGALQNISLSEVPLNASYMWNLSAAGFGRN